MPKPFKIRHDSQVIKERSSRRYSGRSISSQGEDSKPQGFLYQILSLARLLILLPWLKISTIDQSKSYIADQQSSSILVGNG